MANLKFSDKAKVMKTAFLTLLLIGTSEVVFAQNVYKPISASSIPLVYRDSSGNYDGCGIRTVFVTDVPKATHVGDFSVNVLKQKTGGVIGLTKVIYSYAPSTKDISKIQNLPLSGYMIAKADGQALKLEPYYSGEEKNALLAVTSPISAIKFMTDMSSLKRVQVGVTFKGEDNLRIFSMLSDPFSKEDLITMSACIDQMLKSDKK